MHLRLAVLLLFVACTPKPADTDGDSTPSSAETGGMGESSSPGTAPTTTAGSATTTAPDPGATTSADTESVGSSVVTSSSASGGESGTGSGSTGDTEGGGLPDVCAEVCTHFLRCDPGSVPWFEACLEDCVSGFLDPPECAAATAAKWSCVAALPCEEALKFVADGNPTMCLDEVVAAESACEIECGGEVGGGMVSCELMQECGDGVQQIQCDGDTCTCTQDGEQTAQCPDDGFCSLGFDEQRAAITACCGWVWGV